MNLKGLLICLCYDTELSKNVNKFLVHTLWMCVNDAAQYLYSFVGLFSFMINL